MLVRNYWNVKDEKIAGAKQEPVCSFDEDFRRLGVELMEPGTGHSSTAPV